ncbi:hypothetical protein QNH46_21185 [Paenibacillus woosongensis]|uniref:SMODS-associated and fused to various effectors domain-containing protein n=1 Tax=Paenibacillus woosongensis TaxID=307580 RepID=A0AA95L1V3_9BACL|nr:hypothetical protein [Paenibacillus woosongensis]WHX48552.1 hypothetical protein QNH46_21185 [Paenibacillus woosongensis]
MGGKEGARGYLYQSVVSVLNSLVARDWLFVQIEPDTTNDKVDISWFYENDEQEVTQVKSSINNFTKPNIIHWFETLLQDVPNAKDYKLILIGTCSDPTKQFINKLNKNNFAADEQDEIATISPFLDRMNVQLENFDLDSMESKIYTSLNKFLSHKGHTVGHYLLEMMTGAIVYQFFKFSTNGSKVSKADFEKQLLEWVYFNYPEVKSDLPSNKLLVEFYLTQKVSFSNTMKSFNLKLLNMEFIEKRKQKLIKEIDEINKIHIPQKEKEVVKETGIFGSPLKLSLYVSSEYSPKKQQEIREKTQRLLGIQLSDDFFYVGNLKEQQVRLHTPFFSTPVERIGDEVEKQKFEKLEEYDYELEELEAFVKQFKFLEEFSLIPLVLKNEGKQYDEKIKVLIKLPMSIEVLTPDSYQEPEYIVLEKLTGYDSVLNLFLRHQKDSKVQDNVNDSFIPFNQYRNLLDLEKRIEHDYSDFRWYLKTLLDFEIHNEADYLVVEFHFDELNPKENIAFPCYILVKSNESFVINYEITSKNSQDVSTGQLFYIVD